MSDEKDPVGSVTEEAVKLLGALQEWARENGQESAAAAAGAASVFKDLNEHIATGGADCRYCPVCQLIGLVRQTSPEVKQHLSTAASSLLQAAAAMMSTATTASGASDSPATFEKIDLEDGDAD